MCKVFAVVMVGLALTALMASQAIADSVEVKGPHICCAQCVNVVGKILAGVEGVSDAKADQNTKTVTFTAKDEAAAKAGINALIKGGFSGTAKRDGKDVKVELPAVAKGDKVDTVTIKEVHVCCGQCQKAINAVFKDSKVKYEGKGAQRTVIITGGELYRGTVMEALRKAGFNGTVE
jgi:copper chaperone CopZ